MTECMIWRMIWRMIRRAVVGGLREFDLVLVDVADRNDARQDRGLGAERIEKDAMGEAAGAARRQIEHRRGQRERVARSGKAVNQPAGQQRLDQRRKKRRGSGNGEDARLGHRCKIAESQPSYTSCESSE